MLLVIDNYDSFTYNLVQYLGELGTTPVVRRHDAITLAEVDELAPAAIVISPGPGAPAQAGISNALIRAFTGRCPILGVCLGHQCIGEVFGGVVARAPEPVHGKTSRIHHDGRGVFAGLPNPFEATRYHSLVVRREGLPGCLEVSAWTEDGLIMGLRHRTAPVEGVQFHPESILTEAGKALLRNFLTMPQARTPRAGTCVPTAEDCS
ncbi:MAG: aminodeoxychorismate/anthranilate synthase component II [Candidatus Rokubacteria bacterium]|nr:aminodeoxychorismate/anthranilate synthase component II [Candidatus Rokubacteria bacterium]